MLPIKALKTLLCTFILLLVSAAICTAASLEVGARALGMGGAYTAIADDGSAAYWNPAGITQVKAGLACQGGVRGNWQTLDAIAKQDPSLVDGNFGFVGAAGLTFEHLAINGVTKLEVGEVTSGITARINRTTAGTLTLATECTELLALGVNAKYLSLEGKTITAGGSTETRGNGLAADLGALVKVGKLVRVGAVVKDYSLTKMKLNGDPYELPTRLVLGGAVKVPLLGMVIAADLETPLRGEGDPVFHVGLEQPFLGILLLRAGGYQEADKFNLTAGAGLKLGPVLLDVAADLGAEKPALYATAGVQF